MCFHVLYNSLKTVSHLDLYRNLAAQELLRVSGLRRVRLLRMEASVARMGKELVVIT